MKRLIVRTKQKLSFSGTINKCLSLDDVEGIMLKTSNKSDIKYWIPICEIDCIIYSNGKIIKGDDIKNEFRL